VLFICTGNLCRSVMAEGFVTDAADRHGLPVAAQSAGLVTEDLPPPRRVVDAMARRGIDVAAHRSRRLRPEMVDRATVVLCAARVHAWEAVAMRPDAVGRIFVLKEFVRLGTLFGPCPAGQSSATWIAQLHRHRRTASPLPITDEIEDPLGRSRRVFERVATEIDALVQSVLDLFGNPLAEPPPIHWQTHET
jgi:protein-tyrosine phosphatase